jgi:hypothetical protein
LKVSDANDQSAFRPWAEGVDEAVFVAFNPAYVLPDIDTGAFLDKLDEARGWSRKDRSGAALLSSVTHGPPDGGRPLRNLSRWFNNMTKLERHLVGWRDLQSALGIEDFGVFHDAMLSATGNLGIEGPSPETQALIDYADRMGLFLPKDQEIQPALEASIGLAFRNAGCREVSMSDIYLGKPTVTLSAFELIEGPSIANMVPLGSQPPASLWCESVGIACHVSFDSVVTKFRGRIATMKASRVDELLEGTWIDIGDRDFDYVSWPSNLWPETGQISTVAGR